ncbi:hypothetical protein BMW23_0182 [Bodo saltans virus]|uniref:Uncharacterized protein n=1 Tax=Bodo saltans virus TaxID=2024608 RepID=A0A2H4UTH3_9VIRU|nr:hypothetical protein QJ851_gp0177 [Bodo saltans virus]ATZ80240.1 hypothetical protein BMW23_0182 [Bodo saltans virus]
MNIQFTFFPKIFGTAFRSYPDLDHYNIDKIHKFIASIEISPKSIYTVNNSSDLIKCIQSYILKNYEIDVDEIAIIKILIGFLITQYIGVINYKHTFNHGRIKCMIWHYVLFEISPDIFKTVTNLNLSCNQNFEWIRILYKASRREIFANYDSKNMKQTEIYELMQKYQSIILSNLIKEITTDTHIILQLLKRMYIIDRHVVQLVANNYGVNIDKIDSIDIKEYEKYVRTIEDNFKEIEIVLSHYYDYHLDSDIDEPNDKFYCPSNLEFICPLSNKIYENYIWYVDCYYEKDFLDRWFETNYLHSSPMTNSQLKTIKNNDDEFNANLLKFKKNIIK